MNKHPNKKSCYKRPVVGINLTTGERVEFPSVNQAADQVGMNPSWFTTLMRQKRPANDYICAYADDQRWLDEKAEYLMRTGRYERKSPKKGKNNKGLVQLRIDSRTVIYVKPSEATLEYAESYRKQMKGK